MRILAPVLRNALVCGVVALVAVPAYAQPAPPVRSTDAGPHRMMPNADRNAEHGPRMRGHKGAALGFIGLGCGDRAAERLEIALVRLGHRTDLTDSQKPLFETLKTTALTEQTKLSDACAAARPTAAKDAERPDLVDRMKAGLAVETARVAALEKIVPQFEALFDSLSDEQKAALAPRRMHMGMNGDDRPGLRHHRHGMGSSKGERS